MVGRNSLILIAIILMLIFAVGCEQEKGVLKIAIYPEGTTRESYLLILYNSRELEGILGTRKNDKFDSVKDIKDVKKREKILLAEEEFGEIVTLAKVIVQNYQSENTENFTDSWSIRIIYGEQIYEISYSDRLCPNEVKLLVEKIQSKSPIEIDIHGWA